MAKEENPSAFAEARMLVPKAEREVIAQIINDAIAQGHTGRAGVSAIAMLVAAEVLRGAVHPEAAKAAQPFIEMSMMVAMADKSSAKDSPMAIVAQLEKAQRKRIRRKDTTSESGLVLEADLTEDKVR
jgi:hypothetical protein